MRKLKTQVEDKDLVIRERILNKDISKEINENLTPFGSGKEEYYIVEFYEDRDSGERWIIIRGK